MFVAAVLWPTRTGGFKLLVNQLQHGPRSTASLILQLLSILAQHNQHQEDLLKCGVVPTLLTLYRSDDSAVALQAARIMEALSEPASTILQRSLSAGNGRLAADSSSGSSCGNTPTAAAIAAGSGVSGSAPGLQSPYGLPPRGPLQRSSELADQGAKGGQQAALVSSSSDSSAEYVTCNSHNSSAGGCADTQHMAEAGSGYPGPSVGSTAAGPRRSTGPTPRQSAGAALDQGAAQPPASSSNSSIQAAGGTAGSSAPAAVAAAQQAEGSSAEPSSSGGTVSKAGATVAVAAADKPSVELPPGSCSPSSSSTSSTGSPARRVAAVAAALEAAALASSSSSVDGCSASSAVPVSPGAVGRARQSSIPTLSRTGSKTPSGLGAPPLLAKRPTSGKMEQPGEPLQQQQQLAVEQDHAEQQSPSTAHSLSEQQQQQQQAQQQPEQQPNQVEASQQDQRPQQQQVQQQQQRIQPLQQQAHQHLPSRLPRRLPHTSGSSGPHGSSSMTDPSSRTGTPDPIKRRQHPAAHHPSGGAKLPHGGSGSATTAGGRTSASPVHLRVLAAQKKSQRNLASAADGGDSPAPGTPSAGPPQQPFEVAGAGRVMQMAAAIVANAEAAARSASPQRLVKQPSQLQAQLQQQAQQQQQQPQQQPAPLGQGQAGKPSSSSAAAEGTSPAGQGNGSTANGGSSSSSNRPAGAKSPGKADGGVPASASAPAASSSPARDAAAAAAPAAHLLQDKLGGSHAAAAAIAGPPPAAEADDLLSSTYDNLHGLLLKKSDIEVCRCVTLSVASLWL